MLTNHDSCRSQSQWSIDKTKDHFSRGGGAMLVQELRDIYAAALPVPFGRSPRVQHSLQLCRLAAINPKSPRASRLTVALKSPSANFRKGLTRSFEYLI